MNHTDIAKTIVYYLAKNFENFENIMPYDKYFLIGGKPISERCNMPYDIKIGTAVDVLADAIENKNFFGGYVPECVEQANNCNNSNLIPVDGKNKIEGSFKIRFSDEGLMIITEKIRPKKYLDILRTSEGFKQSARLLAIEGDLENIASTIYDTDKISDHKITY